MKNNLILRFPNFMKHKFHKIILFCIHSDIFHSITFYFIKKKIQVLIYHSVFMTTVGWEKFEN